MDFLGWLVFCSLNETRRVKEFCLCEWPLPGDGMREWSHWQKWWFLGGGGERGEFVLAWVNAWLGKKGSWRKEGKTNRREMKEQKVIDGGMRGNLKIRGERRRGLKMEHVEIKPYHFVKREKNSCIYEASRKMKKGDISIGRKEYGK